MRSAASVFMPALLAALSHLPTASGQSPGVATSAAAQTRLYVRTVPPGAQVTVDGKPLGASDGLFLVPAGTARVSVQFDGQEPHLQQVEIAEGQITRVEIKLAQAAAAAPVTPFQPGPAVVAGNAGPAADFAPPPVTLALKSSRKLESPPRPLTKLDQVLAKPIEFECQECPLPDMVAQIGMEANVEMILDMRTLEAAGIHCDSPVTVAKRERSLAASLDAVLALLDLTWTVSEDVLLVTTVEAAENQIMTHVFEVTDLCDDSPATLIDPIKNAFTPESWDALDGRGRIAPDVSDAGSFLVVSQTLAVQRQIQGFFDSLRRLKATPAEKRSPVAAEGYWNVSEPTVQARAALEKKIACAFDEFPLRLVVDQLSDQAGVPIEIDMRAIEDAGIDLDTPVSFKAGSLPLATLLDRMLGQIDLTYVIAADSLVVTTRDQAEERFSTAVYPVSRLNVTTPRGRSLERLASLLEKIVMPESWASVSGSATIQPIDGDVPCLVIRQTTAGHRAVDAFLRALR
jgi:hypothetical protein